MPCPYGMHGVRPTFTPYKTPQGPIFIRIILKLIGVRPRTDECYLPLWISQKIVRTDFSQISDVIDLLVGDAIII